MGVAHDTKGTVVVIFGEKVSWIGMTPKQAIHFARLILRHAGAKYKDMASQYATTAIVRAREWARILDQRHIS